MTPNGPLLSGSVKPRDRNHLPKNMRHVSSETRSDFPDQARRDSANHPLTTWPSNDISPREPVRSIAWKAGIQSTNVAIAETANAEVASWKLSGQTDNASAQCTQVQADQILMVQDKWRT